VLGGIAPYQSSWLHKDVLAGVTLAALAIPECMGYTKIAGMPVITGLYTILIPIAAFALLGSSRHLVVGADSATAAIMYAGIVALGVAAPESKQWVGLAGLSALLAAGMLFVARLARLGFLANFLSRTVLIGFLTGVGVQVAIGQVGGMLGVPKQAGDPSFKFLSQDVIKFLQTLRHAGDGSWQTALVSAGVILILLVFGRWIKKIPGGLVAVVLMIALSWQFDFQSHDISVLGAVPSGLPSVGWPDGVTISEAGRLMATAFALFLVILAQSAATSRAFAVKYSEHFEENTDLVGLAAANVAAGLSGAFVVNGSPTKTEIVDEAESHTQVAQLTTAVVVGVVLLWLTKPLQYLPNAALSAVVFLIGLKLIDVKGMRSIFRVRRDEFWVALATAIVVVTVGVEEGIVLAIVLSIVLHIRRHYHTVDVVLVPDSKGLIVPVPTTPSAVTEPGLVVYRFGAGLFFANAERFSEEVLAFADNDPPPKWIVFDAVQIDDVDYTAGHTMAEAAGALIRRGIVIGVANISDHIRAQLDTFGVTEAIGEEHIYPDVRTAIDAFHRSRAAAG
jgi:high affinity sulfate transporter 1